MELIHGLVQRKAKESKGPQERARVKMKSLGMLHIQAWLVYALNSLKGDGKGAQQNNFRHQLVRLLMDGDSPWTEADYVDAAAARWSWDEIMMLHVQIRGPIGMRDSMHEWLEARRDGLLHRRRDVS